MRILHTADWHLGKRLGRVDRRQEFEEVLDEVVEIARDQKVDLVIVAGDIFDRVNAPLDSLALGVEALTRLAAVAGKVVAIPGNHDSADLLGFLSPLLEPRGVLLASHLRRPDQGGVKVVASRDGSEAASVMAFPFLHEAEVVRDFMSNTEEWFKSYSDRVRLISRALCADCDPKTIGILAGHFFVEGAEIGGGERKIHVGPQYATTPQAIPPGIHYAALGHIHRPQEIAGSPVRARYSGSLLQLDFSERTHSKEVVIIDAKVGSPAKVKSIQLGSGRKLIRVEGDLDEVKSRAASFGDAYLDVRIRTEGPVLGLAEQVRAFLPNALVVQAVYERVAVDRALGGSTERSLSELYGEYHTAAHGAAPAEVLVEIVRSLEEEVLRAAT